jgi:branched-chain amino acid transport system permease protein
MTLFLQQLFNGLESGALYGLIALGYTMVYGIIQLINFAHGEIFMVGAFGGLTLYKLLPDNMTTNIYITLPLVLLFAMLVSVTIALLVERFAYRPLRHSPRLAPLITAIGVSIALQETVRLRYPDAKSPVPFPTLLSRGSLRIGDVSIAWASIFIVVVALVLMALLQAFVSTSKTGRAMRATAQDPDTARLMGIDIDRIIVTTFVIGAMLAAVAGVMQGMRIGQIDQRMGFIAGIKAFTAAVLGGIGNIQGAVLGGFVLGIAEAMASNYMGGGAWKDVWAFIVLIIVLVFRPNGLLGERVASRA